MAGQIFGLDFGTTNSLLSVIGRDGRLSTLPMKRTDLILRWSGIEEVTLSLAVEPARTSTVERKQSPDHSSAHLSDYLIRMHPFTWGEEILIHAT